MWSREEGEAEETTEESGAEEETNEEEDTEEGEVVRVGKIRSRKLSIAFVTFFALEAGFFPSGRLT